MVVSLIPGHQQRVTIVKYHPTASDILVSAALDFTVRVWDLSDFSEIGALEGHNDQVLFKNVLFSCTSVHRNNMSIPSFYF